MVHEEYDTDKKHEYAIYVQDSNRPVSADVGMREVFRWMLILPIGQECGAVLLAEHYVLERDF